MNATSQLTLQTRQRERPPRPRATWRRLPTLASFSFNTQCLCKCTCRESWRLPYAISLSLRFTFCEQIIGRSRPTLVLTFRRPSFMVAYAKLTSWVQNLNMYSSNKSVLIGLQNLRVGYQFFNLSTY